MAEVEVVANEQPLESCECRVSLDVGSTWAATYTLPHVSSAESMS